MLRTQSVLALVALNVGLAQSWDIAISMGDQLVFYTVNGIKTDTVRFNSQNLAALAYDEVHNMMLYVDKQSDNDAICGYNLHSMEYKYIIERNGRNILGIAFDPATESLFFSDSNERSINWISLKPGSENNVYGNLLIKLDDGIPGDIAVDICRGYIYWINTNLTTPTIERARFNGAEREVIINTTSVSINSTYKLEPHSLAIDQQAQKIYWIEHENSLRYHTMNADLNGKNKASRNTYTLDFDEKMLTNLSNTLTASKNSLISLGWCSTCHVWKEFNDVNYVFHNYIKMFKLHNEIPNGIAANYKIKEQIMGIKDCDVLTRLVRNNSLTNNPIKIATEYDGPFCVHGVKFNGQAHCKCTPGYTGERCDVSVCENYCFQGTCSIDDEGVPTCSCNAGYSGERCEVNSCHGYCLNNGDCSLNDKTEPVCQCKRDYLGDRCEVSDCLNYCILGNCSFNDEGIPKCRCNVGFSGERCEVHACHGYCLNNGDCSLNEKEEPVCQCIGNHEGTRCEADMKNDTFTFTNTPTYYSTKRNLTLADLLSNWRKPTAKISVTVEL